MDAFLNECRVTHRSIQNIINHLNMFDKFLPYFLVSGYLAEK